MPAVSSRSGRRTTARPSISDQPRSCVNPAVTPEVEAGEKPVRRHRKARGAGAAETPGKARKARKRREGWNGSVYRRPRAAASAEADDAPLLEDPPHDLGRPRRSGPSGGGGAA